RSGGVLDRQRPEPHSDAISCRAGVIAAGAIGAYVFAFVHGERGLDRLGWLIVMSAGVLGWLLTLRQASVPRMRELGERVGRDSPKNVWRPESVIRWLIWAVAATLGRNVQREEDLAETDE